MVPLLQIIILKITAFLSDSLESGVGSRIQGHAGIVRHQMLLLVSGTFCVRPSPVIQL